MKRLGIAVALVCCLGLAGCRLFEPEPPQYYYPQYPVYPQACPPGYVPAVTTNPCSPAATVPATTPVPRQPLLQSR